MNSVAQIIAAVACLIVALTWLLLVARRAFSRAHIDVGPLSVELEAIRKHTERIPEIKDTTEAINHAVNNVPPGTPPLPARIGELEDMQRWTVLALRIIGAHTGASIPDPPRR